MQGTQINDTPARTVTGVGGVSAVSWGAIFAGTAVAAATSLLLFSLATGLDLASVSTWPHRGLSASLTTLAAITLVVTQWISAGLGGYITGRLRTSWVGVHTHEVFFRDTAHGFITWCVATVLLASGVFPPAVSSPTAALRRGVAPAVGAWGADAPTLTQSARASRTVLLAQPAFALAEPGDSRSLLPVTPASREFELAVSNDVAPASSEALVPVSEASVSEASPRAGNGPYLDAQLDTSADVRDAAKSSVLTALSMLIGAFIASVSATHGGRVRDLHP
jgi:hypothetical protein